MMVKEYFDFSDSVKNDLFFDLKKLNENKTYVQLKQS